MQGVNDSEWQLMLVRNGAEERIFLRRQYSFYTPHISFARHTREDANIPARIDVLVPPPWQDVTNLIKIIRNSTYLRIVRNFA